MRKRIKNIKGLTNKVGASLALLKHRVKNLFVIGAIEKVGLIAVLDSMVGSTPLNLGLNPTYFNEAKYNDKNSN